MNRSAEYTTAEWMRLYDEMKAQRDRLREALEKIDEDLEGRNFLENSSLRDTARAALAEVEGE